MALAAGLLMKLALSAIPNSSPNSRFGQAQQVLKVLRSERGKGSREYRRDMLCTPRSDVKFCRLQDLLVTGSLSIQG